MIFQEDLLPSLSFRLLIFQREGAILNGVLRSVHCVEYKIGHIGRERLIPRMGSWRTSVRFVIWDRRTKTERTIAPFLGRSLHGAQHATFVLMVGVRLQNWGNLMHANAEWRSGLHWSSMANFCIPTNRCGGTRTDWVQDFLDGKVFLRRCKSELSKKGD